MKTIAPTSLARTQRLRAAGLLAIGLVAVAIVVVALALLQRQRIERNERAWLLARIEALVPPTSHDNDLYADRILVRAPDMLGSDAPVPIYRARLRGEPVAVVMSPVAPDGYGGPIELLLAIAYDGTLLGVQVLAHHETPGIGDGFEPRRSDWLDSFKRRSLANTAPNRWGIRKDGGDFDEFTGASITPRAIIKAVRRALEYYRANREMLFDAPAQPQS